MKFLKNGFFKAPNFFKNFHKISWWLSDFIWIHIELLWIHMKSYDFILIHMIFLGLSATVSIFEIRNTRKYAIYRIFNILFRLKNHIMVYFKKIYFLTIDWSTTFFFIWDEIIYLILRCAASLLYLIN
jgi:hypothetical protein